MTALVVLAIAQIGLLLGVLAVVWYLVRPQLGTLHAKQNALHARASEIRETQERILFPHGRVK